MTIRELFREFVVARRRMEDEMRRDITQAWWVVQIYVMTMHKKRIPDLASLLRFDRRLPVQSPDAMRAALELLSRQYGYPLRQVH